MKTFALNILFLAGFIPMNLMAQDTLVVEAKKIPFSAEFKSIHLAEKSFESNVIKVAKGFDYDEGSVDTDLVEKAEGQVVKFVDASGNTVICGYNPFDRFSGLVFKRRSDGGVKVRYSVVGGKLHRVTWFNKDGSIKKEQLLIPAFP